MVSISRYSQYYEIADMPRIPRTIMLTVALPKGELLKNSIRLLQSVGLDFSAFLDTGNRL